MQAETARGLVDRVRTQVRPAIDLPVGAVGPNVDPMIVDHETVGGEACLDLRLRAILPILLGVSRDGGRSRHLRENRRGEGNESESSDVVPHDVSFRDV